jgi:hypothetical protein
MMRENLSLEHVSESLLARGFSRLYSMMAAILVLTHPLHTHLKNIFPLRLLFLLFSLFIATIYQYNEHNKRGSAPPKDF